MEKFYSPAIELRFAGYSQGEAQEILRQLECKRSPDEPAVVSRLRMTLPLTPVSLDDDQWLEASTCSLFHWRCPPLRKFCGRIYYEYSARCVSDVKWTTTGKKQGSPPFYGSVWLAEGNWLTGEFTYRQYVRPCKEFWPVTVEITGAQFIKQDSVGLFVTSKREVRDLEMLYDVQWSHSKKYEGVHLKRFME